ncbi:hypothetical protein [Thalassospira sp.]|uniref:hypothetical protein n=1 Tax=Thalassospira sp. TaxID=1912094 RepID=UPI000C526B32|nr:hypothetical protein [Thalassospira sp.]MBC05963.1 hypothetical protein [Thalassospira sp.]|tara:strand:- start:8444 stop:8890 length:447 start_codon:yes stop_codon:yes gene_type:complete
MGGFTSIVPMAASVLQTGQRISANQSDAQARINQGEAARQAELAELEARQREDAAKREEDLRRRQATVRARQGASGLMTGGSGSASAVLAGFEKAARQDADLDADAANRKRTRINQQAAWREKSLLRSVEDDTVARLNAWFSKRDGWG